MGDSVRQFLDVVFILLYIAIFARVIVSWIAPMGGGGMSNPIVNFIYQITEPILAPLRRVIPRMGMFDFTPMIALIIIVLIQQVVRTA